MRENKLVRMVDDNDDIAVLEHMRGHLGQLRLALDSERKERTAFEMSEHRSRQELLAELQSMREQAMRATSWPSTMLRKKERNGRDS